MEVDTIQYSPLPKLQRLFPLAKIRNIALFYFLTFITNGWFIEANWYFYWTRFMTYGQLGIVDATTFAFGLLMEVPSGAISDLLGKKRTIVASMILNTIGILGMAFANNMMTLWLFFFLVQLGWALYSGAAEALAYDTLIDHGKEDQFDQVISTSSMVAKITTLITILAGGILYAIHFRLSHIAWGIFYLIGIVASYFLIEPHSDNESFSLKNYTHQLVLGTKQLFSPILKPHLLVIFAILGADYLYNWGLIKPAVGQEYGFFDKEQAVIFAGFGIVSTIASRLIPWARKKLTDQQGLTILASLLAIGFLLCFFSLGYWGLIPMFLIATSGSLAYPWVSIVVNREISSKYRATTLSTVALITKIPYVLLAILAGNMVQNGTLNIFMLGSGMIIMATIILSSFLVKKKRIK